MKTAMNRLSDCAVLLCLLLLPVMLRAQSASVSGTVLSSLDERPVAGADVSIPQLSRTVRTDSLGNFRIADLPAGTHVIVARRVGFANTTATLTLSDGQALEVDVMMDPTPTALQTVAVRDSAIDVRLRDFEERRVLGSGRFLTTDVFEKNRERQFSEVLIGAIPGLRTVGKTNEKIIVSSRGVVSRIPCKVQVILDGVSIYNGSEGEPDFDVNRLNTWDVLGVEYYTPATTPPRFAATGGRGDGTVGAACGTLVIWRK